MSQESGHSVKPPNAFVPASSENLAVAWKLWLQQWDWYAIATCIEKKKPEVQVATFMTCIGPEAVVVYNTFNLAEDEARSLDTIKRRFTDHFTPKINETYERYMFFD